MTDTSRAPEDIYMQTLSPLPESPFRSQTLVFETQFQDWNDTAQPYPYERCLHWLIEEQVLYSPDAPALVSAEKQLTYRQLNERANQLAHRLRELGVGAQSLVGICMQRSPELLIGLLAILKAGCAYVPIDPAYPAQRVAFMLSDARLSLLLTQRTLQERLPAEISTRFLYLDQESPEWMLLNSYPLTNPEVPMHSAELAYVIYTSGSTGQPKGVQISHRSLLNLLFWHNRVYSVTASDRATQLASIAFDACVWEIWPYLLVGACLFFPGEDVHLSPLRLRDWLLEQRITYSFLPTPLAEGMLTLPWPEQAPLRALLVGGDRLRHYPGARLPFRLVNHYGPTEFTVVATAGPVPVVETAQVGDPDIGRPIDNTQVYVLDEHLRAVAQGEAGELYIGGAGLARGYLNRPALTAERFVPDPFASVPGARLYRTGDLVRQRDNGILEYIDRIDQQVKIRGFRIELGEIESVLVQAPGVKESLVLAREDLPGQKELVAYLIPASEPSSAFSLPAVRLWIQDRLPAYMLPTAFVLLERFPLTTNGKIDRRALPRPQRDRNALETDYLAPRTEAERALAEIWAEVLHLSQVGIEDNFFSLGGHSLRATQVLTRIYSLFQVAIPFHYFFDKPTIKDLIDYIETHREAQEQKQDHLLRPVSRDQDLPLSFAQQSLWFLDHLDPDNTAYNILAAWSVRGPLHVEALQQSLCEVIQRHEALRTTFELAQGQPVQRIAAQATFAFQVHSLDSFSPLQREEAARRLILEERQRPFSLSQGPLVRVSLLCLAPEEYILVLVFHHIVIDGWSLPLLQRELTLCYRAALSDTPALLPPLPIQYADYAIWQREWLLQGLAEQQLSYWKQHLADAPALLPLPTDRPRPAIQSFRGASLSFLLPAFLQDHLRALSQREGVTLFMTLLATFYILLARYSGIRDVCVGTPVANRRHPELEPLIGYFVNTLVLRARLDGRLTFRQLLQQVREEALRAYQHQDVPLEQVVEALQPQRALSYSPLFQVLFVLQNMTQNDLELEGLQIIPLTVESQGSAFDLTLTLQESTAGLQGMLEYNCDLFDETTIQRLACHYQRLLEAVVLQAEQDIWHLPLLTPQEETQLTGWNATSRPYPHERTIHQLFEQQVERSPEALALVCGTEQLSYRELNSRANRVAHRLRQLGVGPESQVGLYLERTSNLLIGLLGILKAGGAYVPLDPTYPEERRMYMLDDARVCLVLTQRSLLEHWPESCQVKLLCLDQENWTEEPSTEPVCTVDPANPAYLIYTSGSTGRPNGVLIPHRALVNHCTALAHSYGLQTTDRVLQFASLNFDVAAEEIFPAWIAGATVVLRSDQTSIAHDDFFRWVEQERLTVLNLPTPYWQELVGHLAHTDAEIHVPASLRILVIGSDKALPEYVTLWQKLVGKQIQLCNAYGPTEATITAAIYNISPGRENLASVPIGRPIANVQLYVLDPFLSSVPLGVPGELYIGGDGLARGYLHNPTLSAERFIPNPFGQEAGGRLYKTGDIARYLPDGNLEYMGRVDYQIKIRGFRIEPGEIEKALVQHPCIDQCLVQVYEDTPEDKRLAAYIVSRQEPVPTSREIRAFLKELLPDYMLPEALVVLSALPLNSNGKVDRRALPRPQRDRDALGADYLAPRDETERVLETLWASVLGLPRVGINDNFFSLGGHSLLAVQLVARIRDVLQKNLSLRSLFAAPTIAMLAEEIQAGEMASAVQDFLHIYPLKREGDLPLSFAQQRLWFLDRLDPGNATYNFPVAWSLRGPFNMDALRQSLKTLMERHEILRTTFVVRGDHPVQQIAASADPDLEVQPLEILPNETREQALERTLRLISQRSFDLATGPLLHTHLLQIEEEWAALLLVFHHTIIDGWSLPLLIRELSAGYQAVLRGEPAKLPAQAVQYADYALWQQNWLRSATAQEQLAYWKAHLADAPALLALPTDRPRPAVQSFRGATLGFTLSTEWLEALQTFSQREGVTLFMSLLAGFQILLARYTGSRDISIGSSIANRRMPELENLIGFFVNTLVMRTDLSGQLSFRQVVARVREMALKAYGHSDVPFDQVVEALQPQRDLSYSPLFQVLFVLQPPHRDELHLEGVQTKEMTVLTETSMFDLSWSVEQTEAGLEGLIEFNRDLFDPETIERMIEQYRRLLQRLLQEPDRSVWGIPLLSETEVEQLSEWNETKRDYPQQQCLHELIEEQVRRTPDALALVFEEEHLSYGELNRRANRLARLLQRRGVGPDVLVGVCLQRSLDLVVSLLAVLKAGGAYVPLDPGYPSERLAYMLNNAQPQVLLARTSQLSALPSFGGALICVDDAPEIARQLDTDPCSSVTPDHLAYVIYTSGSTGNPKGAMNAHRAICNRLHWMQEAYQLTSKDRVLQKTPFSFDVSVWEFFWPLLTGASLILARPEGHKDSTYLVWLIQQEQITTLHFVPSMLANFLNEPGISDCITLRQVFCSGEALPFHLQTRFFHVQRAALHNLYGPTEAAVDVTFWPCKRAETRQVVPIGFPIANIQIHLLDPAGQQVPVGIPGELYIGGEGVARGYLNEPALTAQKFVPDPFALIPGSRLYRTGDLARYRTDGSIEFLGRMDGQVKIRGCRIEVGEIEVAIKAYPGIEECIVTTYETSPGQPSLAAYLVPAASCAKPIAIKEVRQWLQMRLPDYMLPEALMVLAALPLNSNGKVDRRALPTPQRDRDALGADYLEPRDETERVLETLWASVLGLPRVGINDNFFSLGGHSLLVIQLIARVRSVFQIDLPVRALFETPTIAGLARHIQSHQAGQAPLSFPEFQPGVRPQNIPLALAQQRFWFLDRLDPGNPAYNVPMALRIKGPFRPEYCQKAFQILALRHETLRTTISTVKGKPVQRIATQQHIPCIVLDLSNLWGENQEQVLALVLEEEAERPFKLTTGPLIRVLLLRLHQGEHLLVVTMHHIVTDGWSGDILLQEFCHVYNALAMDRPTELPELPIQYADYAVWQRKWQEQGLLDQQLDYWKRRLANMPEVVLPLDGPQPAQSIAPLAASIVRLSPSLKDALYQLSQREGVTPFMTLLAAFQMLLGTWIGQDDVAVGTLVANRARIEVESLIGCFVNTLVLRTSLAGNPSFLELLRRVQETSLGAYAHQDAPLDAIVNALRSSRQLPQQPLYSAMFALHTMPQEIAPLLTGLELVPIDLRSKTARTDLMLSLSEMNGEISGALEYNADLFAEATIARLARHYTCLVEAACKQPEATLQDLLTLVGVVGGDKRCPSASERKE